MGAIEIAAVTAGLIVTILAGIAAVLRLPQAIHNFRQRRHDPGDLGATWLVLSRDPSPQGTLVKFLITGDLLHAMGAVFRLPGARFGAMKKVGNYYEASFSFPSGADLRYRVVDKVN